MMWGGRAAATTDLRNNRKTGKNRPPATTEPRKSLLRGLVNPQEWALSKTTWKNIQQKKEDFIKRIPPSKKKR